VNTRLMGELIRLRYKLMWAKTRTRNGKIALFFVGYLLLALVFALLAAGGFGAATVAVRSGKAEMVTRIVLGSLFAQALLGTVMMGFGMSAIFSDAVLLLLAANYLAARLIETVVDRMMQGPSGSTVVMVSVLCLSLSGIVIPPLFERFPGVGPAIVRILEWSPPFGAAAAMTRGAWGGLAIEAVWLAALGAALMYLESRPPERRTVETKALSFDNPYDRVAAALGFAHAPLVGWWLKFYARNSRFKAMMLLSLPLAAFLTFNLGGRKDGIGLFAAALGTFPVATFFATSRFMVNQFGYLGGGYRRCLLLPVEPGVVLRTGSYASLTLSAIFIPLGAIAWAAFAPVPFDARQVFMLTASSIAGLFVFHALGLWATLYGPRRGNYNQSLGNDLSLLGNVILIGGVMACLFTPPLLQKAAPFLFEPANWWMWAAIAAAGLAFYMVSLRATSELLIGRREQLMAVVEGRA
jgi:hypothetical protein